METGTEAGRGFSGVYCELDDNGGVTERAKSMSLRHLLMLVFLSNGLGSVGVCKLSGLEAGGGGWTCAFVDKLLALATLEVVIWSPGATDISVITTCEAVLVGCSVTADSKFSC